VRLRQVPLTLKLKQAQRVLMRWARVQAAMRPQPAPAQEQARWLLLPERERAESPARGALWVRVQPPLALASPGWGP